MALGIGEKLQILLGMEKLDKKLNHTITLFISTLSKILKIDKFSPEEITKVLN